MDPKLIITVIGTLAIGACAVILTLRGDVAHAATFAALLVPSMGQAFPRKDGAS
jgi:hypothetical protein